MRESAFGLLSMDNSFWSVFGAPHLEVVRLFSEKLTFNSGTLIMQAFYIDYIYRETTLGISTIKYRQNLTVKYHLPQIQILN